MPKVLARPCDLCPPLLWLHNKLYNYCRLLNASKKGLLVTIKDHKKKRQSLRALSFSLTNEYFPKITRGGCSTIIIALKRVSFHKVPMMMVKNPGSVIIESLHSFFPASKIARPFTRWAIIPSTASPCQFGVIILHSHKRPTRGWFNISESAKVLDHSIPRTVGSRDHVERAPNTVFPAVKSYLLKIQVSIQFFHSACGDYHVVAMVITYSTVGRHSE